MATKQKMSPWLLLQYVAVVGYILFLGFPFLWMFITSLKTPIELLELDQSLIPKHFYLQNYVDIMQKRGLVRSAGNSLIVASISTILTIVVAVPAGYAIARLRKIGRAHV